MKNKTQENRDAVTTLIKQNPELTVREIATTLNITRAFVRTVLQRYESKRAFGVELWLDGDNFNFLKQLTKSGNTSVYEQINAIITDARLDEEVSQ